MRIALLLSLLCLHSLTVWSAETINVDSREALIAAVRDAQAGTTILIAPGEYRGGLSFSDLKGTKEQPIVLAGRD